MDRTFDPGDLVMLPILDANSAEALGEELLARAKEEELDDTVALALRRMKQALVALENAGRARLDAEPAAENDRRKAYQEESNAIGVVHDWLASWTRVPAEIAGDKRAEAKRLHAALFDDGLKFLRLPYKTVWAEANRRMKWLDEHEAEDVFRRLGGLDILENLRAVHQKYGAVLGITKAQALAPESPSIRAPLDTFTARLRDYVVQVAATGNLGDAEARGRATRLLSPLARWQSPKVSPREEPEAPAPEPTPAPSTPIS
jgi:hypothetical protein